MSTLRDALAPPRSGPLRISTDIPLLVGLDFSSSSSSPSNQSVSPSAITPRTDSPTYLFHVLCMHDFESSDPVHLSFHRDDVLAIIKQEHSGWWAAMRPCGDRIGWIPSSFVLPLNRSNTAACPGETISPYDRLPSAVRDPLVPVSDQDCKVLAFQLVSPTDPVLYKAFIDDGARNCDDDLSLSLSTQERSSDVGVVRVPPTPESPFSYRIGRPHFSPVPRPSQLTRPVSPLLGAKLGRYPHPCGVDDHVSLLTTAVSSGGAVPELSSSSGIDELLVVNEAAAAPQDGTKPLRQAARLNGRVASR